MGRALDLARGAVGLASPNPAVGCVLVRGDEVLGEGAHLYDRRDHAEVVALNAACAAGRDPASATAYVTLEPCSHQGRTGPCADALIAARVARVVAATVDPNPRVSGQGIARMRAAGIEVEVGLCAEEARAINDGFARWIRTGRPFVTLKAALSADGMLAPPASERTPGAVFWLTGERARAEVQRMRHASDAVLTGIGTVLADDPLLTDRSSGERRRRLLRVVLDSGARTPVLSRLVRSVESDVLVFCGASAASQRTEVLQAAGIEVVRVAADLTQAPMAAASKAASRAAASGASAADTSGRGGIDLDAVLDELGRRGVLNLLLECGSELNGAFLRAGLVDAAVLFYAEATLGDGAVPFAAGFGSPHLLESRLMNLRRERIGPDLRLTGTLRSAWPMDELMR